ncbi:hypothetical protein D3C71_2032930 [compost metagenome]
MVFGKLGVEVGQGFDLFPALGVHRFEQIRPAVETGMNLAMAGTAKRDAVSGQ